MRKKQNLLQADLQATYDTAKNNATNMKAMHNKLVNDINEMESRKNVIKAKMAAAKTQERINKMTSSVDGANNSIAAFERFEQKANQALDKANAMAELNAGPKDDIKDLTAKYDSPSSSIDAELEALKASLNNQ